MKSQGSERKCGKLQKEIMENIGINFLTFYIPFMI